MNQIVQFVFGVVLARLLSPSEYGIIGMSMVFVVLFERLVDGGLEQALIRKESCTELDYNTMFYTNIGVGLLSFVTLFLFSGAIANFYNNNELTLLVKIMALNLIINAFGMVERAILTRNIDFKRQTKINFISSTGSGIVGILFAFMGYGYWSLAIKTLWQNLSRVLLLHYSSDWKPKVQYSIKSFKELFGFGSKILGASMLHALYLNIYSLVIGKHYSAAELGYYSRANQFQGFIAGTIESSTQRVTYPVLSKIQDNKNRLKLSYTKLIKIMFYLTTTLLFILFINAKEVILLLLGSKWAPSIAYLKILCLSGFTYPLILVNKNIIKVRGRSDIYLVVEIIEKLLTIPAIVFGVIYGMNVLVWGVVINSIITYFVSSVYIGKYLQYSVFEQIKQVTPVFINSITMVLIAIVAGYYFSENLILSLIIKSFTCLIYLIITGEVFRLEEYLEMKHIFMQQVGQLSLSNI